MASADLRAELLCSICREMYKSPITLLCGHNFCSDCIRKTWDHQYKGEYTCPDCKLRFRTRPEPTVNTTLRNIAEAFQRSLHEQEDTGIFCTFCDVPVHAVKFCLRCETSMCSNHLRKHNKLVEHTLVSPEISSKVKKCMVHEKMPEYYCTEEKSFICSSCVSTGEHEGHKVETINEASQKKKEKIRHLLVKLTSQREKTENTIQNVLEQVKRRQEKAADQTEKVTAIFTDIRKRLEQLEEKVLSEISKQGEKVSPSVSDLIQQLDLKKDELSKEISKLEELFYITNPIIVLQEDIVDQDDLYISEEGDDKAEKSSDGLDCDLDECLIIESLHRGLIEVIKDANIRFYLQEPANISLDLKTAANNINVLGDLKTIIWSHKLFNRLETPERFQCYQVLSTRTFSSGQHYWDVEINQSGGWRLGVCYPSSDRKGDQSLIGDNKKSWSLCRLWLRKWQSQYSLRHDSKEVLVSQSISSDRFRVYLDYEAGQLSFYELRDPLRHIYTFTTIFTEHLHAVFYVWGDWWYKDSWMRIL